MEKHRRIASTTSPLADLPFAGHVVVFTGKLWSLSRRDAQSLVQRLGGLAADEVSSRTTMLVVGAEGPARGDAARDDSDQSRKVKRAEHVNTESPGQVRIVSEEDFCQQANLPSPEQLKQQFYGLREIRNMYPAIREDHLRYLEKWGLIQPVVRANAEKYYRFTDLVLLKQASADLELGTPFRAILRAFAAAREGQLAFDFQPSRSDALPAKVVALERSSRASAPALPAVPVSERTLAARYFLEGAALDEGDDTRRDQAAAAYRQALALDATLVPAIVNLANIHYARDELPEAQALYERAITLESDCFEAHFNLGNVHHDGGRYADARVCYLDALALNPGYADAHFYLAVTLEKIGDSQDAKPHWRAYQHLAPDGEWVELAREFSE